MLGKIFKSVNINNFEAYLTNTQEKGIGKLNNS